MANWAMTAYVIEGDKQVLEKIHHAIKHPKVIKDSSEGWEGNVLAALGIEWENRKQFFHLRNRNLFFFIIFFML